MKRHHHYLLVAALVWFLSPDARAGERLPGTEIIERLAGHDWPRDIDGEAEIWHIDPNGVLEIEQTINENGDTDVTATLAWQVIDNQFCTYIPDDPVERTCYAITDLPKESRLEFSPATPESSPLMFRYSEDWLNAARIAPAIVGKVLWHQSSDQPDEAWYFNASGGLTKGVGTGNQVKVVGWQVQGQDELCLTDEKKSPKCYNVILIGGKQIRLLPKAGGEDIWLMIP